MSSESIWGQAGPGISANQVMAKGEGLIKLDKLLKNFHLIILRDWDIISPKMNLTRIKEMQRKVHVSTFDEFSI